jgi:hypothetical protein
VNPTGKRSGVRAAQALAGVQLGVMLLISAVARAGLDTRKMTMTWDKDGVLRGVVPMRDALEDRTIQKKINDGLPVTLVMRGYVYPGGGGEPVALTARTCKIVNDLWNDVYYVVVDGGKKQIAPNMEGVLRRCVDAELAIVSRATLKTAASGFVLAVKVEVNPVSEEMLKQIQSWVTRPTGASGAITPGDALFSSFVGVFMKKVATADKVVEFQTGPLPS